MSLKNFPTHSTDRVATTGSAESYLMDFLIYKSTNPVFTFFLGRDVDFILEGARLTKT